MGGFSLTVTYKRHTSKHKKINKMIQTKSLVFMMLFLLPCCFNLPRFFNTKSQAKQCASSFFRCCSSTKSIPYRCFELNRCPLNFFPLEKYNEICSNIYDDTNEEIDSSSQIKKIMINPSKVMFMIMEELEEAVPKK